jgi:hypothetical protein
MRRRDFLILTAGVAGGRPTLSRAQQKPMPVIGVLGAASPGPIATDIAAFRAGLSETGYVEGQNLTIEYRWAEAHFDRLPSNSGSSKYPAPTRSTAHSKPQQIGAPKHSPPGPAGSSARTGRSSLRSQHDIGCRRCITKASSSMPAA